MSWEHWINTNNLKFTNCDDVLDHLVDTFKIDAKSRKQEIVDLRHFVALWARRHKLEFRRYKNNNMIAIRIGLKDHSSLTHLTNYRTPSHDYDKNVQPLVEAIEKHYICN